MDEVFGSENFTAQIAFRTAMSKPGVGLSNVFDYIIWYAKDKPRLKYRQLFVEKNSESDEEYTQLQASTLQNCYEFQFNGTTYNPRN